MDIGSRLALGDGLALSGKRVEAFAAYRAMLKLLNGAPPPPGLDKERIAPVPPPRTGSRRRRSYAQDG